MSNRKGVKMKFVMLGAPGAGKGTVASKLSVRLNIPHISTGDIFRENIKNQTELGKKAKGYMDEGQLVPDELTCNLVVDRIKKDDCKNGFILDGFPRTMAQGEALTNELKKEGSKIDVVLNVELSDEAIIKRMSGRRCCPECGKIYHTVTKELQPKKEGICDNDGAKLIIRDDDKPETVINRLKVYHEKTEPLVSYYKKMGVVEDIDGAKTLEIEDELVEKFGK